MKTALVLCSLFVLLLLPVLIRAGTVNPTMAGGGGNLAAPGPIGGTTPNTITATGVTSTGSIQTKVIGTPSAPVVTPTGAATHTYYCVATDLNTVQTAASSGTTAPGTNPSTITCGGQTGAVGYIVLKDSTGPGANKLGSCTTTSGTACSVTDTAQALTSYSQNGNSADDTGGLFLNQSANTNNNLYVVPEGGANWTIQAGSTGGFPTDGGFANGSVQINNVVFPAASNLGLQFPSDNSVGSMARMPMSFPIMAVAATTTTQWGEMKIVKALTVENVVFNVGAFSCSGNPAISLFDCSATAGTCTPISTLATSGTLTAIGSTNAATTPTANVAAGEYVAAEFTAGTCTVFNGSVQAMARPQ